MWRLFALVTFTGSLISSFAGGYYQIMWYNAGTTPIPYPNLYWVNHVGDGQSGKAICPELAVGQMYMWPGQQIYGDPSWIYGVQDVRGFTAEASFGPVGSTIMAVVYGSVPTTPITPGTTLPPGMGNPTMVATPCVVNTSPFLEQYQMTYQGVGVGPIIGLAQGETHCWNVSMSSTNGWSINRLDPYYNWTDGAVHTNSTPISGANQWNWFQTNSVGSPNFNTDTNSIPGAGSGYALEKTLEGFAAANTSRLDGLNNKGDIANGMLAGINSGVSKIPGIIDTATARIITLDSDMVAQSGLIQNKLGDMLQFIAPLNTNVGNVVALETKLNNSVSSNLTFIAGLVNTQMPTVISSLSTIASNSPSTGGSGAPYSITNSVVVSNYLTVTNVAGSNVSSDSGVLGWLKETYNSVPLPSAIPAIMDAQIARSASHSEAISNTIIAPSSALNTLSEDLASVSYSSALSLGTIDLGGVSVDLNPFAEPVVSSVASWCHTVCYALVLLAALWSCSGQLQLFVSAIASARQSSVAGTYTGLGTWTPAGSAVALYMAAAITAAVTVSVGFLVSYVFSHWAVTIRADWFAATPAVATGLAWLDQFFPISFSLSTAVATLYFRYFVLATMAAVTTLIRFCVG